MANDLQPNPTDVVRNLPRNKGKVGQTITYRDPFTQLVSDMTIEGTASAADHLNVVYTGSGNRVIHSRYVRAIK